MTREGSLRIGGSLRSPKVILLLFVLLLSPACQGDQEAVSNSSSKQDLTLRVVAPTRVKRPVGGVVLTFLLKNCSEVPQLVNGRFAVAPVSGDLHVVVHRDGALVPFAYRIRLAALRASDFVTLGPGEVLHGAHLLSQSHDLTKPGRYEIKVTYKSDQVPEELLASGVFRGTLRASATLTVE